MIQEHRPQETAAQLGVALAPEPDELTDADLTHVVGGTDGPGSPTDGTSVAGKASPLLV
jgi:hypothetical protein